jgi:hypothetical protein
MRRRVAIVVAIVVGTSCIPWIRHWHFFPAVAAATTVMLLCLIGYGVVRTLLSWSTRTQEKSESNRPVRLHPKLWLVIMSIPAFLLLVFVLPHFLATSTDVYKLAVATAHKSPQFTETLGKPVTEGWFSEGRLERGNQARSEIVIPVYGRTRKGNLYAVALKVDGNWKLQGLSLELTDPEQHIDLLSSQPNSK